MLSVAGLEQKCLWFRACGMFLVVMVCKKIGEKGSDFYSILSGS